MATFACAGHVVLGGQGSQDEGSVRLDVAESPLAGASEDFSFYAQVGPGLYVFLGVTPKNQDPAKAAPNHNPNFFVDEQALVVGVRTMSTLAVDFLTAPPSKQIPAQSPRAFVQEQD